MAHTYSRPHLTNPLSPATLPQVLEVKDADNPREMRVSLSMKLVDQNNGKDLDPSNEVAESEASRRSLPSNSLQAPLELGAVFNTVCSKCGAKGHMSVDCFSRGTCCMYHALM